MQEDNELNMQQFLQGIGVLAETLKLFYDNLIRVGFPEIQALSLTTEYMKKLVTSSAPKD